MSCRTFILIPDIFYNSSIVHPCARRNVLKFSRIVAISRSSSLRLIIEFASFILLSLKLGDKSIPNLGVDIIKREG